MLTSTIWWIPNTSMPLSATSTRQRKKPANRSASGRGASARQDLRRLNVSLSPETSYALDRYMAAYGLTARQAIMELLPELAGASLGESALHA